MNRYYTILILILCFNSCKREVAVDAQDIIDKAIVQAGGERYYSSKIEFDFRDKNYCALRNKGDFKLERTSVNNTIVTTDIVSNAYFIRLENEVQVNLPDTTKTKLANSVNSVHYFSVLPYGLNDKAANKTYLKEVTIKGKPYHKIKVTFSQEGGGTDFDDVFIYWIDTNTYHVDYLAYEFHVNGGGLRFREAYNERIVNGIRFVDYNNYKPKDKNAKLYQLDVLFENSRLELLSKIKLENLNVEKCIDC